VAVASEVFMVAGAEESQDKSQKSLELFHGAPPTRPDFFELMPALTVRKLLQFRFVELRFLLVLA
jgi:hypothetical protein